MRVFYRLAFAIVAVLGAGCGPPRTEVEQPVSRAAYAPRPVEQAASTVEPRPLAPLPPIAAPDRYAVELGRMLFFDNRISGDADIMCATCHIPGRGWADGEALSTGYLGTRYFRNTKTIVNAVYANYFYWDGRLGGDDPVTQVRDSINDSHFLSADARIMLQRMKQIPRYVDLFEKASLGEPDLNPISNAIVAFERTLVSKNVPLDRHLAGDQNALSAEAKQGLALFEGKAGCIRCHDGPYISDGKPHRLGVPENPEVFSDPFRIITMRSTLKFLRTSNYSNMRNDPGHFAVTKNYEDFGTFITPTLREVARTAPYMHNGMLPTLEAVIDFFDAGGGQSDLPKSPLLQPLGLSAGEKAALVEFLRSLNGDPILIELPQSELPEYTLVQDWYKKRN
ncbi:MAG: photosynthetic protein synthase I [Armatimonadetes bacterium]|nr:photosynthetic protein synthase I [Armatimonadota bacterium]